MMQRLTLALRYAEALAASHRRGLLAGWISPQDFFLDERKSPILGLALDRSLESNPRDRNVLRYIAPEVLASKRGSPAGDIYSLGLSLYLLFTCRVPFENSPDHLLHLKRTATLPIAPIALDSSIPRAVSSMILQMANPDPELRPNTGFVVRMLSEIAEKPLCEMPSSEPAFVGRKRLLREFSESLARPDTTVPVTWILNGPSGIGKTRLIQRLLLIARLRRTETLHLKNAPGDSSFGALSRVVGSHNSSLCDCSADLFESWVTLLSSAFRTASLVIAVDDAQWMDHGTSEILRRLLIERPGWMLLCNVRSDIEEAQAWTDFRNSITLHHQIKDRQVDALNVEEVGSILHDVASSKLNRGKAAEMLSQSQGNPFFLLEALRSGMLPIRIKQPFAKTARDRPPSTITEILRRRFENLGPKEQLIVQLLTMAERPVPFKILAGILGFRCRGPHQKRPLRAGSKPASDLVVISSP